MSENENETENSTNEISENKSLKKKFSFKNIKRPHMKVSFSESYDKFQTSIPAFSSAEALCEVISNTSLLRVII